MASVSPAPEANGTVEDIVSPRGGSIPRPTTINPIVTVSDPSSPAPYPLPPLPPIITNLKNDHHLSPQSSNGSSSTQRNGGSGLRLHHASPVIQQRSLPGDEVSMPKAAGPDQAKLRSGPSSRSTVLTIAGFFVTGLTCIATGIIVLCTESHQAFVIAGAVFLGLGCAMLVLCLVLQRKNVVKYVSGLEQDLYFLNISSSPIWKLMFSGEELDPPKRY